MKHGLNLNEVSILKKCLWEIKKRNSYDVIIEFGIMEGYSLSEMTKYIRSNKMSNKIYGFDGFVGLPVSDGQWRKGEYLSTYENTLTLLKQKLGNVDDITMIEGIYEKTLSQNTFSNLNIQKADLIHIDCDLAFSCFHVLSSCRDIIKKDTYLCFHDWQSGINRVWDHFSSVFDIKYEDKGGHHLLKVLLITDA